MGDESQMTKDELLRRIESVWDELLEVLVGLDDAAKSRINPASGWAIKDHLSHLAAWERGITYLLTGRPRPIGMGISEAQWIDLTMDEINNLMYEAGRGQSAAEAMAQIRMAHAEMLDALAALDDDDLQRDYATFDRSETPTGRPVIDWVIGNTYEHYQEHLGYIRETLAA
jgi:hypothetical protein